MSNVKYLRMNPIALLLSEMDNDSLFSSNEEGTKSYKESPMKFDSQKNIGVVYTVMLYLYNKSLFIP